MRHWNSSARAGWQVFRRTDTMLALPPEPQFPTMPYRGNWHGRDCVTRWFHRSYL